MIEEAHATTSAPATAYVPNMSITSTIYTLVPEAPLSDPTWKPSNFLSSNPPDNPKEESTSIRYPTPSDYTKTKSSYLTETFPTDLPTKELTRILTSDPKFSSHSGDTPILHYLLQY